MIRIAVCDDVAEDRDKLYELIERAGLFNSAEYTSFDSGESILRAVNEGQHFDVIFLDVHMNGINGIEAGKQVNAICPNVILIFVTNYPEYAIDAFECNAFHYVLKSESFDKFYDIFSKAYKKHLKNHRFYVIKCKGGPVSLHLSDIFYIEYCDKHVIFHTADRSFKMRSTIGTVADELSELGFIQVHQGYVVNAAKVQRFLKNDIILTDGRRVMMSTRKRTDIMARYRRYVRNIEGE